MPQFPSIDWHTMFVPTVSPFELVLRGSVMYLLIFTAMRVLRRQRGGLSAADLLVIVMVADAAQNALASDHRSLSEGIILVLTIFAWDLAIDWLSFRSVRLHRLLNSPPLLLVKNGEPQDRHLRSEMLTREDLDAFLRAQGVERLDEVRLCYMESNGHISVIKQEGEAQPRESQRSTVT